MSTKKHFYKTINDIEISDLIHFLISFDKKNIAIIFSENFPEYSENMTQNIIGTESASFVQKFNEKFKQKIKNYKRPQSFKTFIQNKLGSLNISDYGVHFSYNGKTYPTDMSIDRIHFLHGYMIDIKKSCDLLSKTDSNKKIILSSSTNQLNVSMIDLLPNVKKINNIKNIIFNLNSISSKNIDSAINSLNKEINILKKEQEIFMKKYINIIKANLSVEKFDIKYEDRGFSLIF